MARDIILIDLDHVIFDAVGRDHMLAGAMDSGDWDAYHAASINDKPAMDIVNLLKSLDSEFVNFMRIGITARPEKWRHLSNQKLMEWGVDLNGLMMRPSEDYQESGALKVALCEKHFGADWPERILFILEDNDNAVAAFKAHGVTVLQVHNRRY